jgi:DNA repair protein RecO (recombination protein O)
MDWNDDGIVLSTRRHGESAAILECLTREHGRHLGLVRGGSSSKRRGDLQAGNLLHLRWRGRLSEHLGTFEFELDEAHAVHALDDACSLAAISAVAAVAAAVLPEREPHAPVFEALIVLLNAIRIGDPHIWAPVYVRWELGLLTELGFGLDLSRCASTGTLDLLDYVSPRSGRAVSREAGAPYASRLLRLPQFLLGTQAGGASTEEIMAGLTLTSHFLEKDVLAPHDKDMPLARGRFVDLIGRLS